MTALVAGLVALLVATVVNVWQRHIEHLFILRKEKRDLFRQFLVQYTIVIREVKNGSLVNKESFIKLDGIRSEISLVCTEDLERIVADSVLYIHSVSRPDRGEKTSEEWLEVFGELGRKRSMVIDAMKVELAKTADWRPAVPLNLILQSLRRP